jgi:hypothetical protein
MAAIGNTNLTLLDLARRKDPDGKTARIIEALNQYNEVLTSMVFREANMVSADKTTIRSGLPAVAWRQINKGIIPSKSQTTQIEFGCGMMEAMGRVDEELIRLAIDGVGFRLSENAAFIEAMAQTHAATIFYGNVHKNPERFTGLSPYYSSTTAASGTNIILGGGSGADNTSIWLVCWGDQQISGIYPRNSQQGVEHNDLGLQLVDDGTSTGASFRAWVDQYKLKCGLAVRDWRFAARIPNVDLSDLATAGDNADTSANLLKLMIQAKNKIPNLAMGRPAWYCRQEIKTALEIKAMNKGNVQLTIEDLGNGIKVTKFLGIPIYRCDQLLANEDLVA